MVTGRILSGSIYFGKMYLRSLVENIILLQIALAMPESLLHILPPRQEGFMTSLSSVK